MSILYVKPSTKFIQPINVIMLTNIVDNSITSNRLILTLCVGIITLIFCLLFRSFWFISIFVVYSIVMLCSSIESIIPDVSSLLNKFWVSKTDNNEILEPMFELYSEVLPTDDEKIPVMMDQYGKVCEMPTKNNPFNNELVFSPMVRLEPCHNKESAKLTSDYFFNGVYRNIFNDPFANLNYMKPWYTIPRQVIE